jgi:hypothetical protein
LESRRSGCNGHAFDLIRVLDSARDTIEGTQALARSSAVVRGLSDFEGVFLDDRDGIERDRATVIFRDANQMFCSEFNTIDMAIGQRCSQIRNRSFDNRCLLDSMS